MEVVVGAGEEREEGLALAEPLALVLDRGHRDVGPGGVAREEVADARAVVRQQALAVRDRGVTISAASSGWLETMIRPALLLVPAEGRDDVVVAVEDAGLAGRRGRRQERLPAPEPVAAGADPATTRCGTRPARTWRARIGWARPSIWTTTRPGWSVRTTSGPRAASCWTRIAKYESSSLIDRIAVRIVLTNAYTNEATSAARMPLTTISGIEARQDQERHDLEDEGRDRRPRSPRHRRTRR